MENYKRLIQPTDNFFWYIILLFLFLVFFGGSINAQTWGTVGTGTNNHNRAMVLYNNKLVVGGDFTTAGGVSANHIAVYDGVSWSALGTGMNGAVYALNVWGGRLIAGGNFTTAGGRTVHNIAVWNGTNWDSLGSGTNGIVYALASDYNSNLFAGGAFTTAGGINCQRIATWNGNSWTYLGTAATNGVNNTVYSIAGFNSFLMVGGLFTTASGVAAKRIATWNGTSWAQLGTGIDNGQVSILYPFGSILYVGGNYTTINGAAIGHIAQWNGTAFSSMVTGVDGAGLVNSIRPFDGTLYVGGDFPHAGGVLVNNIAKWDGTNWTALATGVESGGSMVDAISLYQGLIIVAGQFATTATGLTVNNIASWGTAPTSSPSLISPADSSLLYTRTPMMTWSAPHWAGKYNVQISTSPTFNTLALNDSSSNNAFLSVPNGILQNSTRYYWRVAAMNPRGRGPFTAAWTFLMGNAPTAPVLVSPTNGSTVANTTPMFTWNSQTGTAFNTIQLSTDSSFGTMLINDSNIAASQYNIAGGVLQLGGHYYWRVYSYNGLGRSPNSARWSFTVDNPTGISQTGNIVPKTYNLYQNFPNPFNPSTVIKFDIPANSDVKIVVYDLLGQAVQNLVNERLNAGQYEINWNAGNLASGIYYYKLTSGNNVFVKKLILVK